ncbi:Aste57867_18712 [Aphanomyces stellatus]|uniref:Aste57867_18712 protein n=1 Tax=Aphanomyces stellatus TaxID=120398 RepID=A0A485LAV0_9STRA|nr:hypothetical protein As57867_018648 [Aphanomyces stellatus]VFT95446.1 Aste57867_18712 [Aphanomyces stellatus]
MIIIHRPVLISFVCRRGLATAAAATQGSVFRLYSDGASRGNPGLAGCGAVLTSADGEIVATKKLYLGEAVTNNAAEYHGLLLALELAKDNGVDHVQLHLDSELVVKQMQGVYRVKHAGLQPLFQQAKQACANMTVTFHAIPRAANAAADKLANEAIDDHHNDVGR